MTITERLIELDKTLTLHNEGEWGGNAILPYSSFNSGGVESEVGEFLYGLVRMIKPKHVLETGTHLAVGAAYMGLALSDNKIPDVQLDTLEFLPEIHTQAKRRIEKMGLSHIVKCWLTDAATFIPENKYQLILLDTEPQTRFSELVKFYPYLEPGGYMFIHDLHPHMHQIANEEHGFAWPYGPIPEEMRLLIKHGGLRPFHFETPRGLTGFYKPHNGAFNWE